MAEKETKSPIVDYLLKQGKISAERAKELVEDAKKTGLLVDEILEERRIVPELDIAKARAEIFKVPYIDLYGQTIKDDVKKLIPQEIAENYKLVAVEKKDNTLKVAMINPADFKAREAVDFIARQKKLKPLFGVTTASALKNVLAQYTGFTEELEEAMGAAEARFAPVSGLPSPPLGGVGEEEKIAPVSRLFASFLKYAVDNNASDIHIEPYMGKTRVRFRVDGILHDKAILPGYLHSAIVSRIKVMSNLRLDETRVPQDGRIRTIISDREIDLRVSTLPLLGTEKVSLRVLDPAKMDFTLENLGFEKEGVEIIKRNLEQPHGMMLATGPTGCGKTTTLYTCLKMLNRVEVNIMTLEDPIEYRVEGVNQSQARPEIGYTFASGIRSFVRQDPDIIMVGEIRDNETVELAIHAALTGHLVLSTLHTNNALGAIPRLIDMKAEPFLIASCLNLVIAQRLVRRVCERCRQQIFLPEEAEKEAREVLGKPYLNINLDEYTDEKTGRLKFYRGTGCPYCLHEGYKGRVSIYEILEITPQMQNIVTGGRQRDDMEQETKRQKMMTMLENGYLKALKGITTLEEVLRAARE